MSQKQLHVQQKGRTGKDSDFGAPPPHPHLYISIYFLPQHLNVNSFIVKEILHLSTPEFNFIMTTTCYFNALHIGKELFLACVFCYFKTVRCKIKFILILILNVNIG